jgi:hypothetical protein
MAVTGGPTYDVVPTHLAVQAMRDNGYRNTAYALAELMDNAIQAKATSVQLLICERSQQVGVYQRRRVHQIAVLDNGTGMDGSTLRAALQFGNGTYLNDRSGMGRFGMGLPSASVSQASRLDVWTWQEGVDSALHTYLDLNEIENRTMSEVPEPAAKPIPPIWRIAGSPTGAAGTLVVWSEPDRLMYKSARAIIENSELLIGRMYRKFLDDGSVHIRMVAFLEADPEHPTLERTAKPNDPGYLMADTSTPAPFNNKPMFQRYGQAGWEIPFEVNVDGAPHTVWVRLSFATDESRKPGPGGGDPGRLPHGQHAKKNVGVSVVRAGRELELDRTWTNPSEPTERWWGVEVEFPPALDEIFGVTNNKQVARNFTEIATLDREALLEEGETLGQHKERLREEADPRAPLLDLADFIRKNITQLRQRLDDQTRGRRQARKKRHEQPSSAESRGTAKTRARQDEGHTGASDEDERRPDEDRKAELENGLRGKDVPDDVAHELTATTIGAGLKFVFVPAYLASPAFFSVESLGGVLTITLNTGHPAYTHLVEVLELGDEDTSPEALRDRLDSASQGLKLLLEAWARYEDETPPGQRRSRVEEARHDWGRFARDFLSDGE